MMPTASAPLGRAGRGVADLFDMGMGELPVLMGTLGKSFGTAGAFVAGSEDLIETLIQFARSYIYTTSIPPAVAAATRASLRLLQKEDWRRERLQVLIQKFRSGCEQLGLELINSQTPIQPIMVGDTDKSLHISEQLEKQGILVTAIRPPTVPKGTARLRVTLSASHTEDDVDRLLSALERTVREERL